MIVNLWHPVVSQVKGILNYTLGVENFDEIALIQTTDNKKIFIKILWSKIVSWISKQAATLSNTFAKTATC